MPSIDTRVSLDLGGRNRVLGEIIEYATAEYPFAYSIRRAMEESELSDLHRAVVYARFRRETDQQTVWHERYYRAFDFEIAPVYRAFIESVIRPLFSEPIAAHRVPTLRIHLPGNVAVGEFHRDRDYNHPQGEVNFLLPVTQAWGTNTIWIESAEGAEDFAPVALRYGQVFCFDGWRLKHGNKLNGTGCTRVSFDFRIIPIRLCNRIASASINTNTRFSVGHYYYSVASPIPRTESRSPVDRELQASNRMATIESHSDRQNAVKED